MPDIAELIDFAVQNDCSDTVSYTHLDVYKRQVPMLNVKSPGRMKQVLNKSGSSLVWVAVTMVVLLILIGGILTMATIYHHSSVKDNSLNQAYFSARSAVDAVTTELQTQPNGKLGQAVADLTPGRCV